MGDIADQIFDEMLDDYANMEMCPIHKIYYNAAHTCCYKCEEGESE